MPICIDQQHPLYDPFRQLIEMLLKTTGQEIFSSDAAKDFRTAVFPDTVLCAHDDFPASMASALFLPGKDFLFRFFSSGSYSPAAESSNVVNHHARDLGGDKTCRPLPDFIKGLGDAAEKDRDEFGRGEADRVLLAGLPGTGKTTVLHTIADRLMGCQTSQLEKAESQQSNAICFWQAPILLRGADARQIGFRQLLAEQASSICGFPVPFEVVQAAIRCGYFLLLVDGIEEWTEDGRLSPSSAMMSEFLRIVARTGRFICTVDSRYIRFSMFISHQATEFGERFQDPSEYRLLELAPFIEHRGDDPYAGAVTAVLDKLTRRRTPERGWRDLATNMVEEWNQTSDPLGVLTTGHRLEFPRAFALKMYQQGTGAIPPHMLWELVFDALHEAFRESYYVDRTIDFLFGSPIFEPTSDGGLRFRQQLVQEAFLADALSERLSTEGVTEHFCHILSQGHFHERLACQVWLQPRVQEIKDRILYSLERALTDVGRETAAGGTHRRNLIAGLMTLLVSHYRLFVNDKAIMKLPRDIHLCGLNFSEHCFDRLALDRWDFSNSILHNARFEGGKLKDCSFTSAVANGLVLEPAETSGGIVFTGARLAGAKLNLSSLKGVLFSHADLTGAEVTVKDRTSLDASAFHRAVVSGAAIEGLDSMSHESGTIDFDLDLAVATARPDTPFYRGSRTKLTVAQTAEDACRITIQDVKNPDPHFLNLGTTPWAWEILLENETTTLLAMYRKDEQCKVLEICWPEAVCRVMELANLRCAAMTDKGELLLGCRDGLKLLPLSPPGQQHSLSPIDGADFAMTPHILLGAGPNRYIAVKGYDLSLFEFSDTGYRLHRSRTTLHQAPVKWAVNARDLAVAFPDASVALFSHSHGLRLVKHHQTSFAGIDAIAHSNEQRIFFIIGHWPDDPEATAVMFLDGRTGDVLLYLPYAALPEESELDRKWRNLSKRLGNIRQGSQARLEDIAQGNLDNRRDNQQRLLNEITATLETQNFVRDVQNQVIFRLEVPAASCFQQLHVRYNLLGGGGRELPLSAEPELISPGDHHYLIPVNKVSLEQDGKTVLGKFSHTFKSKGVHRIRITLSLGAGTASLQIKQDIRVTEKNPFAYQKGLQGENAFLFVGHEDIMQWVTESIGGDCCTILGSRRQGKSSLLHTCGAKFMRKARVDVVPVYISFEPLISNGRGDPSSPDNHEMTGAAAFIEQIFRYIRARPDLARLCDVTDFGSFNTFNEAENRLDLLGARLGSTLGRSFKLVILADEVDCHTQMSIEESAVIGSLLHNRAWLWMVSAGLPSLRAPVKTIDNSGLVRFFAKACFLQPLSDPELKEIIQRGCGRRFHVPDHVFRQIAKYATGRPYDLQVLMHHSVAQAIKQTTNEITTAMVDQAFKEYLVPIYRDSYMAALLEFEEESPERAREYREYLNEDFDDQFKRINTATNTQAIYKHAFKWGYVRNDTGSEVHMPYALVRAWFETRRETLCVCQR